MKEYTPKKLEQKRLNPQELSEKIRCDDNGFKQTVCSFFAENIELFNLYYEQYVGIVELFKISKNDYTIPLEWYRKMKIATPDEQKEQFLRWIRDEEFLQLIKNRKEQQENEAI